jgi:hypothetical protein
MCVFPASAGKITLLGLLYFWINLKLGEISNIRYKSFNRKSVNLKITTYVRQHIHSTHSQDLGGARNRNLNVP